MEMTGSDEKKPDRISAPFFHCIMRLSGLAEGIAVFTPLVTAVGIFGYQVFLWARQGAWIPISFDTFLMYLGLPPASYFSPKNWIGLAKAVHMIFNLPAAPGFSLRILRARGCVELLSQTVAKHRLPARISELSALPFTPPRE